MNSTDRVLRMPGLENRNDTEAPAAEPGVPLPRRSRAALRRLALDGHALGPRRARRVGPHARRALPVPCSGCAPRGPDGGARKGERVMNARSSVLLRPMHFTRPQAIAAIREKLAAMCDDEHCACEAAAHLGVFCRGFRDLPDAALRGRFDWIARSRPGISETSSRDSSASTTSPGSRWAASSCAATPRRASTAAATAGTRSTTRSWRRPTRT